MPGKQLVGLTCSAVVEKAALKVDCCADCHDYTKPDFGNHRLHFAHWNFVKDGLTSELYICCNVDKALSRPQKHQKITVYGGGGGGGAGTMSVNYVATSMTNNSTITDKDYLESQLKALADSAKKIEEGLTAQEQALADKIGAAYVKKLHPPDIKWDNYCSKPECLACMTALDRYWSYKLQTWVPLEVYVELNALNQLDMTHPLMSFAEGHVCAPQAYTKPSDVKVYIPEYTAWMCTLPDGKPTFGLKYCANPMFMAAVKGKLADATPPKLIVGIPDGDKITDWIPSQHAAYITEVVYLPPEGPMITT